MTAAQPGSPGTIPLLLLLAMSVTACDHFTAADAGTVAATTPASTPVPSATIPTEPATCPEVVTGTDPAVVDTLHRSDGTCVPAGVAVVYRCDPSSDPIAVLDLDADRHRFLGGDFAVEVPTLPDDARPLGISALGRVSAVPGDPRWLFVESDHGIERWMALPPIGETDRLPSVQLIGDSILDGATASLVERLATWTLSIDAEVGRSTSGGASVAESLFPPGTDLGVIELGVNDVDAGVTAGNADRVLAAADAAGGVIWVNAHGPEPQIDAVNQAIAAALGRSPDAALADWDTSAPTDALSSDGVHLLDASGTDFVDFLAPILQAWHLAATGRGADRCGAEVASAA